MSAVWGITPPCSKLTGDSGKGFGAALIGNSRLPLAKIGRGAFWDFCNTIEGKADILLESSQSGHFGTGPTSNSTSAGFRFIVAGEIIHLLRANCISLEGRMIMSAQSSSATDRLLG
jgi:hypothetical protein